MDTVNNFNYYSIICPKYDKNLLQFDCDWLLQVRKEYFSSGKRQKNKIIREFGGKVYHYAYVLEPEKPMRWKRMQGEKIVEKSRINNDGTYEILFFDENRFVSKIMYFDTHHNIKKVEYFCNNGEIRKKVLTLTIGKNELFVTEYKDSVNHAVSYKAYPVEMDLKNYTFAAIDKKFTSFLCITNRGAVTYSTKEQILALEDLKSLETTEKIKQESQWVKEGTVEEISNLEKNVSEPIVEERNDVILAEQTSVNIGTKEDLTYRKIIKTENNENFYYFGQMSENLRNGNGVTLTESGTPAYVGSYVDDKKDGLGVFCNRAGEICYVGNFHQDKKHNVGIIFDKAQGKIIVKTYADGIELGTVAEFDEFGNFLYASKPEKFISYTASEVDEMDSQLSFDEPVLMQNNALY